MSSEDFVIGKPFTHSPIRPVRQDVLGEVVFMAHWLELMARELPFDYDIDPPNEMLKVVLWDLCCELTERHAQVCASFIRWLGTNNGRCFLEKADSMSIRMRSREEGYLCAWAIENHRRQSRDCGWRTIEAVLSQEPLVSQTIKRPTLSFEDGETIEALIGWLGTDKGERFVVGCRKDIEKQQAQKREALRERHRQGMMASQPASL